ncbi:PTS sorbose transporter subunit IIC [Streptococcus agalactiae LMG 14747]|uniref:PTS sorbose transporter subunit IIC n=1 Tax=Streptococcus agalactiae LMG 14747 TaxID=1154860 RepID=V6Z497_STRAG|nr:PTS sorbose transporter subunit IIC [Streptococcus agalactiae LMG 14747]
MSNISTIQVILLTLLSILAGIDPYISGLQLSKPVIAGFLAGIIMGDIGTGLVVGATLQLMVLGVGTFGGASIPDFGTGAIIGTALASASNNGIEFAIGISVPVGLLLVQLDIFARFANLYFLHRIDRFVENEEFDKINREAWFCLIPIALSRAIPVSISLIFGNEVIQAILGYAPDWLMTGLRVAGSVLPVVGIAILLRYLPVQKFFAYLVVGYVLAAYLGIPMMGIALIGFAVAYIYYNNLGNKEVQSISVSANLSGLEIEDDEI